MEHGAQWKAITQGIAVGAGRQWGFMVLRYFTLGWKDKLKSYWKTVREIVPQKGSLPSKHSHIYEVSDRAGTVYHQAKTAASLPATRIMLKDSLQYCKLVEVWLIVCLYLTLPDENMKIPYMKYWSSG